MTTGRLSLAKAAEKQRTRSDRVCKLHPCLLFKPVKDYESSNLSSLVIDLSLVLSRSFRTKLPALQNHMATGSSMSFGIPIMTTSCQKWALKYIMVALYVSEDGRGYFLLQLKR
uniref:Uncharacterized protein n=1 Tax=Schistocephalus solidus TaxID=70667 RepID=A0A0X3PVW6_SCHSO